MQEVGEIVRQIAVSGMGIGPQTDVSTNAGSEWREVGMHLLELGLNLSGVTEQSFAGPGQGYTARMPFKHRRSERGLQ